MNRVAFSVGWLVGALALVFSFCAQAGDPEAERAMDKQHLLQIWKAIMEYKKEHGQVPDYLSDLVPKYLPDQGLMLSPSLEDHRRGSTDPKFATSYSYEFSARAYGNHGKTFRELKEEQMKEFGPVVPILRCFAHGEVMNVAYSGDYYESELYWESSPAAKELSKKLGAGPGFDDGDVTEMRVVDDETGEGVPGAEVRLTQRTYHFLPLPDRTLKTGEQGKVRIPLGPADPPSRVLTISVRKPGLYGPTETWREGALPEQKTWHMAAASTIGGVVKDHEGRPLEGARVAVLAASGTVLFEVPLGFDGPVEPPAPRLVPVDTCVTDAEGHWHCDSVPKDFVKVRLVVSNLNAWETEFRCGSAESKSTVDSEALLEQAAEFRLEPAVLVQGVVLAPDGSPLANEEVTMTPVRRPEAGQGEFEAWQFVQNALQHPRTETNVQTDANGHFSTPWSFPAELALSTMPNQFSIAMQVAPVVPGLKPLTLKTSPRRRVLMQVRNGVGEAVAGAEVRFIGRADAPVEKVIGTTDGKGEFAWDAAPTGEIGFTFRKSNYQPSTEWVPSEKTDALVVELRGYPERGRR